MTGDSTRNYGNSGHEPPPLNRPGTTTRRSHRQRQQAEQQEQPARVEDNRNGQHNRYNRARDDVPVSYLLSWAWKLLTTWVLLMWTKTKMIATKYRLFICIIAVPCLGTFLHLRNVFTSQQCVLIHHSQGHGAAAVDESRIKCRHAISPPTTITLRRVLAKKLNTKQQHPSWPPPTITTLWQDYIVETAPVSVLMNLLVPSVEHNPDDLVFFDGTGWKERKGLDNYKTPLLPPPSHGMSDHDVVVVGNQMEPPKPTVSLVDFSTSSSTERRQTKSLPTYYNKKEFFPWNTGKFDMGELHKEDIYDEDAIPYNYFPMATVIWFVINVGLFITYGRYRVDSSAVAWNNQLVLTDYGRAFSGQLAHDSPYHLLVNMSSLFVVGNYLDGCLGSIPLFLWTCSFFPLLTLVMLALIFIRTKYFSSTGAWPSGQENRRQPPAELPIIIKMVGFSGILYAYVTMLALQIHGIIRPFAFFGIDISFKTYHFFNERLSINFGILVQVVFVQILLPRSSFTGHLAGIVLGFIWHTWHASIFLPSLEYMQPCILFPILWIIGKQQKMVVMALLGTDLDSEDGPTENRGSSDRNGYYGNSRWRPPPGPTRTSSTNAHVTASMTTSMPLNKLFYTTIAIALHCFGMVLTFGLFHALAMSEWLILIILTVFFLNRYRYGRAQQDSATASASVRENSKKIRMGMVSRGLIVLTLVVWFSDSMTMGGWLITYHMWKFPLLFYGPFAAHMLMISLMVTRWILWYCLLAYTWQLLHSQLPPQQQQQRRSNFFSSSSSSTGTGTRRASGTRSNGGGIWYHLMGWMGVGDILDNHPPSLPTSVQNAYQSVLDFSRNLIASLRPNIVPRRQS